MGSPKKIEAPQYPFLVKQSSMCNNITFDHEFIGKYNTNNNLDDRELVNTNNNVMISKQNFQTMRNPSPSSSSSSSSSPPLLDDLKINGTFSDKDTNYFVHDDHKSPMQPMSEMSTTEDFTLEEFLIQNGAINYQDYYGHQNINPGALMSKGDDDQIVSNWQQQQDLLVPMPVQAIMRSGFQGLKDNGYNENKMMDVGYLNKMTENTSDSQADQIIERTNNNGTCRDEMMAKTIERRRRRMIKNRESAARSRARKQAHTNQLQENVKHLEITNKLLRKRKEMENLLDSSSTRAEPRYQLRRTSSATF